MVATVEPVEVTLRGPIAEKIAVPIAEERWDDIPGEVCAWGGAGTGKSFAAMLILVLLLMNPNYGGIRIMWCRKTRESITQSSIVTFAKVLATLGMEMSSKPDPSRRQQEVFHTPKGVNVLVWRSLEDPYSAFSAEYDIVVFEECIQIGEAVYELASGRCLRNFAIPRQFIISLTNPGSKSGWIWRRMFGNTPRMVSCKTTIEDNPFYWDAIEGRFTREGQHYWDSMAHTYSGARKLRLLRGEWTDEEGWVLDGFDAERHVFNGEFVKSTYGKPTLAVIDSHPCLPPRITLEWTFGSMDFGFRNPGSLQAWGVDGEGRLYLLEEVYYSEKDRDWWIEHIKRMTERYRFEVIVADHEPERHKHWNSTIRKWMPERARTRDGEPFIRNCEKSRGDKDALKVDVVRSMLRDGPDGVPGCFLMERSRKHAPDPALVEGDKPTDLMSEIPQLVWDPLDEAKVDDKTPVEKLKDGRANHAFDAWVYAGRFARDRAMSKDWSHGASELHKESMEYMIEQANRRRAKRRKGA